MVLKPSYTKFRSCPDQLRTTQSQNRYHRWAAGFLGLDEGGADDASILDPIEAFGTVWKTTARKNRALLDEVYNHTPRDSITNFSGVIGFTLAPLFVCGFLLRDFLCLSRACLGKSLRFVEN
jgi:hypothetical protein